MEASAAVQRRLMLSLTRSLQCQCSLTPVARPLRRPAPHATRKRLPSSSRSFSTSRPWRQDESSPSSSPAQTSKEAVREYTSAVQKIIDGHRLKDNMTSRQYAQLQTTVAHAEVLLDAPHPSYHDFGAQLTSLKGEIDPILQRQFHTTNLNSIRAQIPTKPPTTPPSQPSQTTTSKTPKPFLSESLDSVFPKNPKPQATPTSSSTNTTTTTSQPFPYNGIAELLSGKIEKSAKDNAATSSDLFSSMSPSQFLRKSDAHKKTLIDSTFGRNEQTMHASLPSKHSTRETLRLKPSLGRTVSSHHYQFDLTRAFRSLESLCSRNGVRRDLGSQRFHVRRGQKKKDLRISRWRKLFAAGFLAECARVRRMRKQGW